MGKKKENVFNRMVSKQQWTCCICNFSRRVPQNMFTWNAFKTVWQRQTDGGNILAYLSVLEWEFASEAGWLGISVTYAFYSSRAVGRKRKRNLNKSNRLLSAERERKLQSDQIC
jgi:hypothetical protein